jgi:hypothetical protein
LRTPRTLGVIKMKRETCALYAGPGYLSQFTPSTVFPSVPAPAARAVPIVGLPSVILAGPTIIPRVARRYPYRSANRHVGLPYNHNGCAIHRSRRRKNHLWSTNRHRCGLHKDRRRPAQGDLERYAGLSRRCIGCRCNNGSQCDQMFSSHNARFDGAPAGVFEKWLLLKMMALPGFSMDGK